MYIQLQKEIKPLEINDLFQQQPFGSESEKTSLLAAVMKYLSNEDMTLVMIPTSVYEANFVNTNKTRKSTPPKNQKPFCLSEETKSDYITRIVSYMEECEPFLKHDFSIHKLADALGLSPTYTSRVINQVCGKTFRDFVNGYRVKKACIHLRGDKMKLLTIEAIAFESGFHSRTAFYNAFKKVMKASPGEYISTKEFALN